jgi:tetratricopeptide (TPR) repeat protein
VTRVPLVDTLRPRTLAERLAQAYVRREAPWAVATDQLRVAAERDGDLATATRAAMALASEYPYSAQPYLDAARIALARQRHAEGLNYARLANARREAPRTAQLVGLLLLRLGDHAAAMPYLERAAQLAPGDERMTVPLTAATALPALEDARAETPTDTAVLFQLAFSYAYTQQYEKARDALAALRRVAPDHPGARDLERRLPAEAAPARASGAGASAPSGP